MLDCRSTGQPINPAPGAWFILKFIPLAQVVPRQVHPYSPESWPKHCSFTPERHTGKKFLVPNLADHIPESSSLKNLDLVLDLIRDQGKNTDPLMGVL